MQSRDPCQAAPGLVCRKRAKQPRPHGYCVRSVTRTSPLPHGLQWWVKMVTGEKNLGKQSREEGEKGADTPNDHGYAEP